MSTTSIKQAVILAGGKGTRLRPLTDNIPKPMVPINDRPFLLYLIELLKENGIEEIVLLLGYMHEKISEYFSDGSSFGIHIKYSIGAVEDETGTRLNNAKALLHDTFLLMYCDNYHPLNLKNVYAFHKQHGVEATVTVYTNKFGVTKNNIAVDQNGFVQTYDKSRTMTNLTGVDIGFFILNKSVLTYAPETNFSFEKVVVPQLIERKQLVAFGTDHRYYSIGSLESLPSTSAFLSNRKVIFLDRDGVINQKPPKADYVKKREKFIFMPGSIKAMQLLDERGYEIYIITNQPGIARGMMTVEDLKDINTYIEEELRKNNIHVDGMYQCLHGWDDGCDCRKPKPGMLFQAATEHNFDLTKATFIGDDERDFEAGNAAGCKTILLKPGENLLTVVQTIVGQNL